MHVALVSPSWSVGFPNGIVTYVGHMRSGLLSLGHHVSILSLSGVDAQSHEEVYPIEAGWICKVNRVAERLLGRPTDRSSRVAQNIVDTVLRLHERSPIDVVEMEESFGWFREVQERLPMPVVVKLHGPAFLSLVEEELTTPASQAKIFAERQALSRARYVTSPSLDTLIRTRRHCELPPEWGRVVPNPIGLEDGTPLWSREMAEPNLLLFVGRFDKRKGGDIVIRAFGQLLLKRPDLRLIFVGPDSGLTTSTDRKIYLEEFIRDELPVAHQSQVKVMGRLGLDQIVSLRCRAAMTLVCSRWDNQPNTALEALAQGCPLVGIDSGGLAEIIEHGISGLLARAGDQDDLCRQVLHLLDHPDAAESFGVAGRRYAHQNFDVDSVVAQTVDYYLEALSLHRTEMLTIK